jgi:hypothetical protein
LFSVDTTTILNGLHTISARATDGSSNVSSIPSVTVRVINVPGAYLARISAGDPSNVTDCAANVWVADQAYTPGSFGYSGSGNGGYVNNAISGVCTNVWPLYQRERYSTASGGYSYLFDCPPGIYETTLLEAETYWSGAGKRVFNAFIQVQQVLTNFDIFVAAGGQNIPISRVFTNAVTNSQLQILFTPVVDNARVSGVQVRKIADVFSDTDGIPDWWRLAYFGHALGEAADKSRGSDDADGNGISNLTKYLTGTNPLDPASYPTPPVFNITQISVTASNVQINCSTVSNWSFQLECRSTLDASSSWTNIGPALLGTNGTIILSDGGGATNFTRYYRVQAR